MQGRTSRIKVGMCRDRREKVEQSVNYFKWNKAGILCSIKCKRADIISFFKHGYFVIELIFRNFLALSIFKPPLSCKNSTAYCCWLRKLCVDRNTGLKLISMILEAVLLNSQADNGMTSESMLC